MPATLQKPRGRKPKADTSITMRVASTTLDLIDSAAHALGKSRTEFMLESARRQAEDALLDRRVFVLDADAFDAFTGALADPPPPNAALLGLMKRKAPWEG